MSKVVESSSVIHQSVWRVQKSSSNGFEEQRDPWILCGNGSSGFVNTKYQTDMVRIYEWNRRKILHSNIKNLVNLCNEGVDKSYWEVLMC